VNRRLTRCRHDRMIAGVASGMAEYLNVDPTIIRLLWIVSVFFGGLGLLLYFVMAIIVPLEPEDGPATGLASTDAADDSATTTGWHSPPVAHRHVTRDNGRVVTFFGVALILLGSLALIDAFLPTWADGGRFIGPAFILGIGALLVFGAVRREPTPR